MVLNCSLPAQWTWTTRTAWRDWTVEWLACSAHYAKLQADRDWLLLHGQPPDWRRSIAMSDDVGTHAADLLDQPAARAWTLPEPVGASIHGQPISAPWGGLLPSWGGLFPPRAP